MELIGTAYAMGIGTKIKANGDGARLREKQDFWGGGSSPQTFPTLPCLCPGFVRGVAETPCTSGWKRRLGFLGPQLHRRFSVPPPAARSGLSLLPMGEDFLSDSVPLEQKQRRK